MPIEAKDIFEANSRSVRELLSERGLGLYVPPYQRPFSWDKDKVDKLLEDTLHGFRRLLADDDSFTFLGTIITIHDINYKTVQPVVREEVPGKVLTVIDGQQRLTILIMFCIGLHNHIRLSLSKLLRPHGGTPPTSSDPTSWLNEQSEQVISDLSATFFEQHTYGSSPKYPRIIRAFLDQWSRKSEFAKYESPIANLIAVYCGTLGLPLPTEFKPVSRGDGIEGEPDLIQRYHQITRMIKGVIDGKLAEDYGSFPNINQILDNKSFQRALINHDIPSHVVSFLESGGEVKEFILLLNLLLFARYVLQRIAVTVVRGKNEDYAFTIFESLNTTGEPLTAFETFRPRVVSAEGLERYEGSEARKYIDEVADYLAKFKAGEPLQRQTRDLLVAFALSETGEKLSKRLSDQRRYLKDEYERYEKVIPTRVAFVQHLRNTSSFIQHAWVDKPFQPILHDLPIEATGDIVKLCLAFHIAAGHTIVIGPLVRFYSIILSSTSEDRATKISNFTEAIKAITAFSVLWRASRRGTANIDQEYRDIMSGNKSLTGLPPLARSLRNDAAMGSTAPIVDVTKLKIELIARLKSTDHGNINDKAEWIKRSLDIPAYKNSGPIARFLLLAAYHDSVEDETDLGLIVKGREGVSPCLTFDGWRNEKNYTIEHIAPDQKVAPTGWDTSLYDDLDLVQRLGNLVLVPAEANSSLGARPWKDKAILYSALGAKTKHEAERILRAAEIKGIVFAKSTEELVDISAYMPQLCSLGSYTGDWCPDIVEKRTKRILDLAWDHIYRWLE
jgi:hypothetical protein